MSRFSCYLTIYARTGDYGRGIIQDNEFKGKPVVATSHILEDMSKDDLLEVFHEFCEWDRNTRPGLPEEEQLFHREWHGRKVWVIESGEAFTLMYPEDY